MRSISHDMAVSGRFGRGQNCDDVAASIDSIAAYAAALREQSESIKEICNCISAGLLIEVAGLSLATCKHRLSVRAAKTFTEVERSIGAMSVPAGAGHAHGHLLASLRLVGDAVRLVQAPDVSGRRSEKVLRHLQQGWDELRLASRKRGGPTLIDFRQCCGWQGAAARTITCVRGSVDG